MLSIEVEFEFLAMGLLILRDENSGLLTRYKGEVPEIPLQDEALATYEPNRLHEEVGEFYEAFP